MPSGGSDLPAPGPPTGEPPPVAWLGVEGPGGRPRPPFDQRGGAAADGTPPAPSERRAPSGPAPLTVSLIDELDELTALVAAWPRIEEAAHAGAVFRSPAWLSAWWRHLGARRGRLASPAVWQRGRLLGVLPAWRAPGPLGLAELRLLGDGIVGSDHLGVLAHPADQAEAARAVALWIADHERRVRLDGVDQDDPLVAALVAAGRSRGAAVRVAPLLPAPYLDLRAAGGFAGWLARLPRGMGGQLRRRRRWLEGRPGFALTVASGEAEVAAALEELLRLHEARWAAAGGSDGIDGEPVRTFHREAARALARRGEARVFVLWCEGAPRAALYAVVRGGRMAFYQSGLDPAWRARSVGTVVLGAAIEAAFGAGLEEFDFLRGDEAYKAVFASGRRQLVRLELHAGARGRALALGEGAGRALRAAVLARLPAPLAIGLRQARRSAARILDGRWPPPGRAPRRGG